jgi:inner membrane protein
MSPGAHLLSSWLVANTFISGRRERRIATLAGLAPDLDAAGWLIDRVNLWENSVTDYYFQYHHLIGHNLFAGIFISFVACMLASTRRILVFGLVFAIFHLHLLCDLAGSRGPDGYQWPIYYLYPIYPEYEWVWSGQWELSGWQNIAITLVLLTLAITWAWRQRYSFVQVISVWLDREFFGILERYGFLGAVGQRKRPD